MQSLRAMYTAVWKVKTFHRIFRYILCERQVFVFLIIIYSVDTGIRIPSVQSETAPPYYTAIGIESQSSQQLGVDNKALPVLLGMEEDDSERTVTVKRIRGPGSESELPDPQSIQEATQGSSYIRLGPHSPCKHITIFPLNIHHVMKLPMQFHQIGD